MFTLDEAIKGEEAVADVCKGQANTCDLNDPYAKKVAYENGRCADEHKQIAEWLKELKKLKEKEPCEDCVSREFMYELGATCIATRDKNDKLIALGTIENLPSVTPTHKKGKWITKYHGFPPEPTTVCSECGFDRDFNIHTRVFGKIKYCPNCGTKMEEK